MTVQVTCRIDGTGTTRTRDTFTIRADADGVFIDQCWLGCSDDFDEFTAHLAASIDDMKHARNGGIKKATKPKQPKRGTPSQWPNLEHKKA